MMDFDHSYGYDYDFDLGPEFGADFGSDMIGAGMSVAGGILAVVLVIYALVLLFGIACYVLQSLSLHTIAKRRGIHNPWLAWLPVGNMWILGSISDQYQYVAKGQVRNRRKVLMWLALATVLAAVPLGVIIGVTAAMSALGTEAAGVALVMLLALFELALAAVTIVAVVFEYIALYDLYRSCDPGNAVLFLVLSIIFSVTMPFFLLACRKKDLGMPPRRPAPAPVEIQTEMPAPEQSPAEEPKTTEE